MSEPFVGEIRIFPYNFAPRGWAQCNGQILQVQTNQALFALIGNTYGGNGQTTFGLPNLIGRVPIHPSTNKPRGTAVGEEAHVLTINEMPQHTHTVHGSVDGVESEAEGQLWGKGVETSTSTINLYSQSATPTVHMNANAISSAGNSAAHNNMQPYAVNNYCIALIGIFPSRP